MAETPKVVKVPAEQPATGQVGPEQATGRDVPKLPSKPVVPPLQVWDVTRANMSKIAVRAHLAHTGGNGTLVFSVMDVERGPDNYGDYTEIVVAGFAGGTWVTFTLRPDQSVPEDAPATVGMLPGPVGILY